MDRTSIFMRKDQLEFLRNLPGHIAEHIRKAIDDYIDKRKNGHAETSPEVDLKVDPMGSI